MKMISKINNLWNEQDKINSFLVFFILFLFPLVAIINYVFDIRNGSVSYLYRIFSVSASFYLLFIYIKKYFFYLNKRNINGLTLLNIKKNIVIFFFFLFWVNYIIRFIIDLEYYELYKITTYNKIYYYLYLFLITLLPLVSISTIRINNFNFLNKLLEIYLKIINVIFILIFFYDKLIINQIEYRFLLTKNNFDFLDAISIAVYSGLLVLVSFFKEKTTKLDYLFLFIGLFNVISTASRGPLIFLILTIVCVLFFKFQKRFLKMFLILIVILIAAQSLSFFLAENQPLISRISNSSSDQSTANRIKIILEWKNQFWNSPILGSHFLVVKSKMYSHNIFLDILLSTGIIGLILIAPAFLLFIYKIIKNKFETSLGIIALFFFLNTFTSGTIYNMNEFWIIFILILNNFHVEPRKFLS
jgi:hypothetical protein